MKTEIAKDKVWKFVKFLLMDVWMWMLIIMGIFPLLRGEFIFAGILFLMAVLFHWWMMTQEDEINSLIYYDTRSTGGQLTFKESLFIFLVISLVVALVTGLGKMLFFIPKNWYFGDWSVRTGVALIIVILVPTIYLLLKSKK